ncbi:MAG: Uma2 family endonuclease [Caldilineaceae bacterium]
MSELLLKDAAFVSDEEQEFDDMGSYNHSLVQGNLAYLLRKYSSYSAFIELSLDVARLDKSQFPNITSELKPDVCAYPRRAVVDLDLLTVTEMPELAIEVVSPRQGVLSIVEKFQAYFALGIKSCWLVEPITAIVRVYHPNQEPTTFAGGNIIDKTVNIEMPLDEIFR